MSKSNAVQLGVEAFNKGQQASVECQAVSLITTIRSNQKNIELNNKTIEALKKQHNELAEDVVTQKRVLDTEFTAPLNPNQQTIVNAIKAMNDQNQEQVKVKSQGIINQIKQYEGYNAQYQKAIDNAKESLSKLSADVVTVEQVS